MRTMRAPALYLAYRCCLVAGVFVLGISGVAARAADSRWFARSWQTDDGLPNNYVTAITQTSDGYLWVGTQGGVVRFDGVRFSKFSAGYPSGNPDQSVRALASGHDGSLWIMPFHGAPLGLGPDFSRLALPDTSASNTTWSAVVRSGDGATWIASTSEICRVQNGEVTRYTSVEGLPSRGIIYGLAEDTAGNVWLAKGNNVGFFQRGYHSLARFNHAHITPDRSNGVWVVAGTHLFKYDVNGLLRDCGTFQPDTARAESYAIIQDHTGAVWIGTDGSGLFRYDGSGFEKIEISHPYILSLAEDREGNIWAGTAGGGLNRISRRGVWLEGMESGGSVLAIQSICEDASGKLWGVTQNGLLVSRVNGKWTPAFTHEQLPDVVTCVAADRNGALWIGTRDVKFYRWQNDQLTTWDLKKGFASHTVVAFLPASTGDLWIGEYGNPNAVQCLHDGRLQTWKVPPGCGRVNALAEDSAGAIWIGSARGKLLRAEGDQLVEIPLATSRIGSILCLYPTPDGTLWIGYDGAGLGRLKNGIFTRIGTEQGLFDDRLAQMIADEQGWFWFGSGRGIFKVRRDELESAMDRGGIAGLSYVRYGQNEGLFSVEANSPNEDPHVSPNAFRSSDGCLWMPMRKALAVIDPRIFPDNPGPTGVLLTRAVVDGRTVAAYGPDAAENSLNLQALRTPLRLLPGHRTLEFEFTSLNFGAPENVRFRHRLAGFEEEWVEGDQRSAGYSRLAAGNYRFQVEARNGGGQWSTTDSTLDVVVEPFFWNTWWFRLLALSFFTSAVIAAVRYVSFRRLRERLRIIEQAAALERERLRIAKDLHDSLGADVTEVGLIAESARVDSDSAEIQKQKIMTLAQRVRALARSLDTVVWTVNPRNDSLDRLSSYLCDMFQELFRRSSVRSRLDVAEQIPAHHLTPEERSNLFLASKEAMNNVLKHSGATEVWLRIRMDEDRFRISIEDNGCGIDPLAGEKTARNGVKNMRSRIEEIRGAFELNSTPGKGTRVGISLSFAGRNGAPTTDHPASKD